MNVVLAASRASLGHGPTYTVVIVIGLILWLIAIVAALSRWRR